MQLLAQILTIRRFGYQDQARQAALNVGAVLQLLQEIDKAAMQLHDASIQCVQLLQHILIGLLGNVHLYLVHLKSAGIMLTPG